MKLNGKSKYIGLDESTYLDVALESYFFHLLEAEERSVHTIWSYRDCWNCFIRYLNAEKGIPIGALRLCHVSEQSVLDFLRWIEVERRVSIGTRNCRLAAFMSFTKFALQRNPSGLPAISTVSRIPFKKSSQKEVPYLDEGELELLLKQPDQETESGYRDFVLLWLLAATGARISEALQLNSDSFAIGPIAKVKFHGKGKKERVVIIDKTLARQMARLVQVGIGDSTIPIFRNRSDTRLSRSGFAKRLKAYAIRAQDGFHSIPAREIHPHTLRHTFGMRAYDANVDLPLISTILGHADPKMTSHYAKASMKKKEEALKRARIAGVKVSSGSQRSPLAPDVLSFLKSLSSQN